jgi:hypothetical protein
MTGKQEILDGALLPLVAGNPRVAGPFDLKSNFAVLVRGNDSGQRR